MAGTPGHAPTSLSQELLTHGHRFSFFQALRLLALMDRSSAADVRVRPDLSFGFPAADLRRIEALPGGGYQLTATFLSLYGTSSPLPAFYTEDLFKDVRNDSSVVRDFLDIIHRRLYTLLYESWKKYQVIMQIQESEAQTALRMLYALTGLAGAQPSRSDSDDFALVRYAGLLGAHPRSAMALQTLLADILAGPPVEIVSCIPRTVPIPVAQRLRLGSEETPLGVASVLGQELTDIQGKFRIRIGPLPHRRFRSLLQGGPEWRRLMQRVKQFLVDPLEFDLEFILAAGETRHARLGGDEWNRLGLDTVLFTDRYAEALHTVFCAA